MASQGLEHETASLGHLAHVGLYGDGFPLFGLNTRDDILTLLSVLA